MMKCMNRSRLQLLGLVFAVTLQTAAVAGPRDAQWKAVQDAVSQGLPQTAITNLEPIIAAAMKDKAYAEATKAIGQKIALEGNLQGNRTEERVVRLEAEIAKAPAEMKPVLQTLLAHWYWSYFQQNRWRFLQRTQTSEPPGKDFTTWDLARLFAEIDKHFQDALAADKLLQATPIAAWDGLLEQGTMPDTYRPTLYDFLAQEALQFYTSGEQAGAKAEGEFELLADSLVLDDVDQFLQWKLTNPVTPQERAILLYQHLLIFHQADHDPSAFYDADLARLVWGWNTASGDGKNERFKAALKNIITKRGDHPLAAMASWNLARVVKDEGDFVEARKLARQAMSAHPGTPGAKNCANLITEIEAKSASISTERVWNSEASITVHYRNVDQIYFRAIKADWESFLDRNRPRPENLSQEEQRELVAKPAALTWSVSLPATADFQEHTFRTPAPTTLKPGFYFIFASHDPGFGEKNNQISLTTVWVSELALVLRTRAGLFEGFVLEAASGEPIGGAEVNAWYLDQDGSRVASAPLTTDTNGFFSLQPVPQRVYLFRARHRGRELASAQDLWNYDWRGQRAVNWPRQQAVFFTDRAIYRPGQTVQYKGICLQSDQRSDRYATLAGEPIEVVFRDANGQEIARAKHRANDYGSFAGSFTAPRDRVMGQMQIEAQGRCPGAASFRVEEYKRPKFAVTLDAPKVAPKLGEEAIIPGKAASYTGAAIDGAMVKWRVERQVRWPWWYSWWRGGFPSRPAREIAHGTAVTGADGAFTVEFIAKPDLSVAPTDEPTFVYSVTADVTDGAGETRSADRGVRVGYAALEAVLTANDWQEAAKPVELKIATTTLDGEPQVAAGAVKVYRLKPPAKVVRGSLGLEFNDQGGQLDQDLSNPNNWELGEALVERGFTSDTNGTARMSFTLAEGAYRVLLETQDRFGKKVTGRLPVQVLQPGAPALAIKIPNLVAAPDWEAQPGGEFTAVWGTGYETGRAFIEIEQRDKFLQRYWTTPGRTQQQLQLAVTEAMRGGFTLHVTQVRENRGYLASRRVNVPWKNQKLDLKWEHFVSKLMPGQQETWALEIRSPKSEIRGAEKTAAEMVATLYDASLDAFAPQGWLAGFGVFRQDFSTAQTQFGNLAQTFQNRFDDWNPRWENMEITYRHFPADLTQRMWGYGLRPMRTRRALGGGGGGGGGMLETAMMDSLSVNAPAPASAAPAMMAGIGGEMPAEAVAKSAVFHQEGAFVRGKESLGGGSAGSGANAPKPDLSQVIARQNLNETAFFFPQLTSDSNGVVRLTFTMPEALTQWRFLGFAHDRQLRAGLLEAHAVTAKDIMVQPNAPRFLREGDTLEFSVKISNQSDQPQSGAVKLTFSDAATLQPADALLGNRKPELPFAVPAKESRSYAWRISVPDGAPFLSYKAVASTGTLSDGEEGCLPVLSRRVFVTESLPLPIRGKVGGGEVVKKFEFTKLLNAGKSSTLQEEGLTVQMVSQPAWYAVLALPYLMEFPYECSEQTFNRLYANALARHIANSDPKIRRVFDLWKGTPALESPLEKNQELKSVMIEETPWWRQAKNESEARRNIGILFDNNRLNSETASTLQKLGEMQLADGRWPWFPGGYGNDYITLYIVTGFGRLRHLDADVSVAPAVRALRRLDEWMRENYERIQRDRKQPEEYVPSPTDALYLYGRSFFLKDLPVAARNKKAVDFFLAQARKYWLQTDNRLTQGQLALALKRFNAVNSLADATPLDILKSLKERSVTNEELGRFWRDTELSWWWYRAPIETQALMIEAFDEVAGDAQAVDDCRVWLLKQKQTQDWKTTTATADAVYALLLRGKNLLASDQLVEVSVGGINVTPGKKSEFRTPKSESATSVEPGTGFYERRFSGGEVKPQMGEITVKKLDEGVSWGSVHWQYFEDISKVTPYEGTPLKLKKTLFTKVNTAKGPTLEPVKSALAVGDELVVRLELRVDRDMEYVHLRDQRGSGTEPVNVLSRYKYQDGLAYYESTRDTASHFFIDYLPKGNYVFEYSTRVQQRGRYQTGLAQIQCLYAPEFNSHSESLPLVVK
jgi:uncharacterized protein YfaS (alpha-2-macroglobulin family)